MSNLRDDAKKVDEALAALAAHDERYDLMLMAYPGTHTPEAWTEMAVARRRLSSVLEERAGILARLVLAVTP